MAASLLRFDQTEFDLPHAGLDAAGGYYYIPQRCRAPGARCKLHVFAHGCGMSAATCQQGGCFGARVESSRGQSEELAWGSLSIWLRR